MSNPIREINFDGSSLPIRRFKLEYIVPNASICMIAKRGSGKSFLVKAILNHFKNILPGGVIISPTDKMNEFYGRFFPKIFIHYTYKTEILEKLLSRQEMIIEKTRKKYKEGKKLNPRAFLIMDDCLASKGKWAKDPKIMEVLMNGRHYQLMYILTMQFPLGISPELRNNFDYVFLLADDTVSNQKRVWEHYAGIFPTFNNFKGVFNELTKDYGAMVIVNRGKRETFHDKIFWYKADKEKINRIGDKQFNNFNDKNFDKDWKVKMAKFNTAKFFEDRKRRKINVEKKYN